MEDKDRKRIVAEAFGKMLVECLRKEFGDGPLSLNAEELAYLFAFSYHHGVIDMDKAYEIALQQYNEVAAYPKAPGERGN